MDTKQCPALGKKCHRCKKLNNFWAVCRTKLRNFSKIKDNSASSDEFSSRVVEAFPISELEKGSSSVETRTSGPADESNTGHTENRGLEKKVNCLDTPDVSMDSDVKKFIDSSKISNRKDCYSNEKK